MSRLFFDGLCPSLLIKVDNAEPFRVIHIISKHRGSLFVGSRLLQILRKAGTIENIVPQNHGTGFPANKLFPKDKGLGQTIRRGLHLVRQMNTKPGTISQKTLKIRQILGRRNNQNIPYSRQHQRGKRIKNHGLVINRKQLLRCHPG